MDQATAADFKAVVELFRAGSDAWNRGDVAGYLATYADTETVRWVSGGQMLVGRKAIAATFKERFPRAEGMGKLSLKNLQVDVLTPLDALAVGEWHQQLGGTERAGIFTVRLAKFPVGWRIVLDHASALD